MVGCLVCMYWYIVVFLMCCLVMLGSSVVMVLMFGIMRLGVSLCKGSRVKVCWFMCGCGIVSLGEVRMWLL